MRSFEDVLAATGPLQVLSGAAFALYHHCAVWLPTVSVAVVLVTSEAVRLGGGSVVNADAVAELVGSRAPAVAVRRVRVRRVAGEGRSALPSSRSGPTSKWCAGRSSPCSTSCRCDSRCSASRPTT